ncbi:MAG TPA: hypothetical protein PKZ08_02640 [Vicinamibacterales bacterium]|nr:hypothetical protein [Vicinamibacterales bacterium]
MAVVKVVPSWKQVNASVELDAGVNASTWTAAKLFHVVCDTITNDNAIAILNHQDIPVLGEGFSESYPYLTCRRVRVLDPRGPYLYNVVAEYSGKDSPLLQPWKYAVDGEESVEEFNADAVGKSYLNPLGHPIIGIRRPVSDLLVTLTRNEAAPSFAQSTSYRNSVNAETVTINGIAYAAGKCRLKNIRAVNVIESPSYYWSMDYVVAIRGDTWKRRELCKGNYYWDGTYVGGSKRLVAARTSDGAQYRTVRLDLDGRQLAESADDVYQEFDDFPPVSWTPLGFI